VRIKLEGYRCMPAPHALYSKMLAERTASRNVLVLFYLFISNLSERISATRAHLRRRFPGRRSCLLFDCM